MFALYMESELQSFLNEEFCNVESDVSEDDFAPITPVMKPRRKRIRQRKRYPEPPGPKIVKDDIRRSYANMLTNVLNSGHFPLVFGFVHTFYVPNVRNSYRKTSGISDEGVCHSLFGINRVAQHWCNAVKVAPDSTFELSQATVDYPKGKIVCEMKVSSTHLYDDDSVSESSRTQDWIVDDPSSASKSDKGTMIKIMNNVEKSADKLVLRNDPQRYSDSITITICTDENKMVKSVEVQKKHHI